MDPNLLRRMIHGPQTINSSWMYKELIHWRFGQGGLSPPMNPPPQHLAMIIRRVSCGWYLDMISATRYPAMATAAAGLGHPEGARGEPLCCTSCESGR